MRLAFRTIIPASLMLGSGLVLSVMHAGAAQADCTDLPARLISVVNAKSILRIPEALERQVDYPWGRKARNGWLWRPVPT